MLNNILYKLAALIIRIILRINGGYKVIGIENIPAQGGALITANHISYLDPPVIGSVLPRKGTFMARHGLFDVPVLGWMIRGAAFPVDRENPRPSSIKESVRRLRRGELIIMFPEGRRSDSGRLLEAKKGAGMIAALSRVPVVPTLVVDTNMALKVDAKWLSRSSVTVVFGRPVNFSEMAASEGLRGQALYEKISVTIMDEIRNMQKRYEQ